MIEKGKAVGLFLSLFGVCAPTWAGQHPQSCAAQILLSEALAPERYRTEEGRQFTEAWRNDAGFATWIEGQEVSPYGPNTWPDLIARYQSGSAMDPAAPQRVDLTSADGETPSAWLQSLPFLSSFPPVLQQERVFLLRQGDTVILSDGEYVLGPFLEDVDNTFQFTLPAYPGEMLRIPFFSYKTLARSRDGGIAGVRETSAIFIKGFVRGRPQRNDISVAGITHTGAAFDYVRTTVPPRSLRGDRFLFRYPHSWIPDQKTEEAVLFRALQKAIDDAPVDEWEKRQGLVQRARRYYLDLERGEWRQENWSASTQTPRNGKAE